MNRPKHLPFVLVSFSFCLALLFSTCSRKDTWQGTIEVINDVTHVTNQERGLWNNKGKMNLEEKMSIASEKADGTLLFAEMNDIAVDHDGTIYICDFKENSVKIFSSDGDLLNHVGAKGTGPGELFGPVKIALGPDNRLYVLESGTIRVSVFLKNGEFLTSFKNEIQATDMAVDPRSGNIYLAAFRNEIAVKVYNDEGKVQNSFGKLPVIGKHRLGKQFASGGISWFQEKGLSMALTYPYDIRFFDHDGALKTQILTACSFFLPPQLITFEGGFERLTMRGEVLGAYCLPSGHMLVKIVDHGENYLDDYKKWALSRLESRMTGGKIWDITANWQYYYDLYDEQGRFLQRFPNPVKTQTLWYIDHEGNAYFVNKASELPGLTKYKLTFTR